MTPHVVLVGEAGRGALLHSYERGFRDAGCRVTVQTLGSFNVRGLRRAAARVQRVTQNVLLPAALRSVRADLVMVLKGQLLSPGAIQSMRRSTGAAVVNYYPDDPFSDAPSNRLVHGTEVLAAYDACFTFARHLIPQYRAAGARRAEYLPFARDPYMHGPPAARGEPEFDVVFAGNIDAYRIPWLEAASSRRLAVFGEDTISVVPEGSPLRRATFLPAAYEGALVSALSRGAISLNVMRVQNAGSHNMRSFESPSSGAFTLSQATPELRELFRDGNEVAFVDTPGQLADALDVWLARPADRARVAEGGFARVARDTYARRAATVLAAVGIAAPVAAPAGAPAEAAP